MSEAVASAFVEVGLKDTGVAAGMNNLMNQVLGFKNAFVGTLAGGAVLAGAGLAAAGIKAITENILKTVDSLDELRDRARETQTPIEQLSEIEFAGKLNGIDNVSGMLNFLTKNLGLAAEGNKELSESFQKLGIDAGAFVASGQPAANLMAQILDKLKSMPGGAAAAMATTVFGRSGFDVMRFGSGADFNASIGDARRAGATVSQKDADAADAFNDELTKLSESLENLNRDVLMPLVPAMSALIARANDSGAFGAAAALAGATVEGGNYGAAARGIGNFLIAGLDTAFGFTEQAATDSAASFMALAQVVGSAGEAAEKEAARKRAAAPAGILTELGPRQVPPPATAEDLKRLEESRGLLNQAENADALNRFADAMDAVNAKQAEIDNLSRSSLPAIMDAGSYWSTAQSAIADDTKRQQLKIAQDSLERLTNIAATLQKATENGGAALTFAP